MRDQVCARLERFISDSIDSLTEAERTALRDRVLVGDLYRQVRDRTLAVARSLAAVGELHELEWRTHQIGGLREFMTLHGVAEWLLREGIQGSPKDAVAKLRKYLTSSEIPYTVYVAVDGLELDRPYSLTESLELTPFESDDASPLREAIATDWPLISGESSSVAALIYKTRVPKEVSERKEIQHIYMPMGENDELLELRDVCLSLCASAKCGPQPLVYVREPPDWFPCRELRTVRSHFRLLPGGKYDCPHVLSEKVPVYVSSLLEAGTEFRKKIRIALERLCQSRSSGLGQLVDDVIDLAIALEVLFIGGKESSSAYKVAVRASRLLGHDSQGRRRIGALVAGFYRMRNEAVHRGRLENEYRVDDEGKLDAWALFDSVWGIASAGTAVLLERKSWPDWRTVENV